MHFICTLKKYLKDKGNYLDYKILILIGTNNKTNKYI